MGYNQTYKLSQRKKGSKPSPKQKDNFQNGRKYLQIMQNNCKKKS